MNGKNMLEGRTGPITQSIDAIKSLLAYVGRSAVPLPSDVSLDNGRLVLVLSNKKDAYYTVTATKCSCPAASYHHGPCKHQRKYFAEIVAQTKPIASEPLIQRGGFKPFDEMLGERATKARATPLYVDTLPDTNARDIAYHSIREDREMWPAEA